ncbi:MAG TPA: acyl carrier protein [Gammaproteobacteria bacterium]|nr:acyl carrier protein [Gammaproteobacteria bacterium]
MTHHDGNAGSSADVDRIIAALKQILSEELDVGLPIDQIDSEASLERDLKIDSVAMIELIAAVESHFDFAFHDSDLAASSFANLRVLAGVIAKRVAAKS